MEWPPATSPLSLIKAAKAFFGSPDQEPTPEVLEALPGRLEELRRGDQPDSWDKLLELLADASRDREFSSAVAFGHSMRTFSNTAQRSGVSPLRNPAC